MYAEDLRGDNGCDGETVEDVNESLPCFNITPSFAFIIKSINYSFLLERECPAHTTINIPRVTFAHS